MFIYSDLNKGDNMADYTKEINTPLIFNATDVNLTSPIWKIDGVQISTSKTLNYTFTTLGTYTVTLEGSNTCALCTPISKTIQIVPIGTIGGGDSTLIIGGIVGLGLLYIILKAKK